METTVSFKFQTAFLNRLIAAYCLKYDYTNRALQNETQAAFARRMLIDQWYTTVADVESGEVLKSRRISILADVKTNPIT